MNIVIASLFLLSFIRINVQNLKLIKQYMLLRSLCEIGNFLYYCSKKKLEMVVESMKQIKLTEIGKKKLHFLINHKRGITKQFISNY